MAMVFLLTTRGVPQVFYGTEVLMSNKGTDSHGVIRSDFPGGWAQDSINAFSGEKLDSEQREAQQFCKRMLNWRKTKSVIHHGKLKHFIPKDGVYVYFRYNNEEIIMVAINNNPERTEILLDDYKEMGVSNKAFYNIVDKRRVAASDRLVLEANTASVFEIY
jgi:glycosidase